MALRQVALEDLKETIEARVERRTAQLQQSRAQLEIVNAELRTASARAEESSRSKSAFLATVSHEIRNLEIRNSLTDLLRRSVAVVVPLAHFVLRQGCRS
jgi:signal transduction histidine kinase